MPSYRSLWLALLAPTAACGPIDETPPESQPVELTGSQTTTQTTTQTSSDAPVAVVHPDFGSLVTVSWEQPAAGPAWVEYSFEDGVWEQTPERSAQVGAQEQLLLGILIPHAGRGIMMSYDVCC